MIDVRTNEQRWYDWLISLPAWKFHFLTKDGRELDWHDDFISGVTTLEDLDTILESLDVPTAEEVMAREG